MTRAAFARLAGIGRYPAKGLRGESLAQTEVGHAVSRGDELTEAAAVIANATLHLFVTGPNASEDDRRGRPTGADLASLITDPLSTSVVVCGPQGLVTATKAAASAAGVPDAAMRSDPFSLPRPANFEFRPAAAGAAA